MDKVEESGREYMCFCSSECNVIFYKLNGYKIHGFSILYKNIHLETLWIYMMHSYDILMMHKLEFCI